MPHYVTLVKFNEAGREGVEDLPKRAERVEQLKETLGGELKGLFLTFGQYDMVGFSEMPDDETTAKLQLGLAQEGGIETETLRAFDMDEVEEILEDLPGPG